MKENWYIHSKKADFDKIAKKFNIDKVTARVIRNRDIVDINDIENYLNPDVSKLSSPWLFKDMDKAVDILKIKVAGKNKIRIICDYDVDGICSGFILYSALKEIGAIVDVIAPDREKDGYGINKNLIKKASDDGVNTILTCDNGIAAFDEVNYAKSLGMDIVITDHHEVPFDIVNDEVVYKIPLADAVIDHKQKDCDYPFKELCGAMVAYQLMRALYSSMDISEDKIKKYLMYAGIATVADVVDLIGENRAVVSESLRQIKKTTDIGISALINALNLNRESINSGTYGFIIGPTLNASGRISVANKAIKLLAMDSEEKAKEMAAHLKSLNDERKAMCEKGVKEGLKYAKSTDDKVLVVEMYDLHESIAGIVAGRIKEELNKPTLVLTKSKSGLIKGSGRSIETYNLFEKMSEVKYLFEKFGGHSMAAGFSLKEENVSTLRIELNRKCGLSEDDLVKKIWIDTMLPFGYISLPLARQIKSLDPFGKGNPTPLFAEARVKITNIFIMGKNSNVVKAIMVNDQNVKMEGILFGDDAMRFLKFLRENFGESVIKDITAGSGNGILINITYNLDINIFNDEEKLQIRIKNYNIPNLKVPM